MSMMQAAPEATKRRLQQRVEPQQTTTTTTTTTAKNQLQQQQQQQQKTTSAAAAKPINTCLSLHTTRKHRSAKWQDGRFVVVWRPGEIVRSEPSAWSLVIPALAEIELGATKPRHC
jgi:hypothetical protein